MTCTITAVLRDGRSAVIENVTDYGMLKDYKVFYCSTTSGWKSYFPMEAVAFFGEALTRKDFTYRYD